MTLTRRGFMGGVAGAALISGLAACGNKPAGSSSAGGGGGGGNGSSATAWALSGGVAQQAFQSSFDKWNKAHSDEQIKVQFIANDAYKEKIRTAVGSGQSPTLIYSWAGGTLAAYHQANQVADLSDGTKDLQKKIIPSVLEVGKIDGKLYAVPNNNTQPELIYTNKDVLAKAGLDGVPKTFDDLLSAVDKLKSSGCKIPIALAGASQWPELMWIEYLCDRYAGPELFKKIFAGDATGWTDPGMLKAAQMVQQLVNAGAFGDKFGSVVADASADAALLHTGKSAMLLQGAWVLGTFLSDAPAFMKAGKLGWGAFPAITGGKGDPSNVYGNPANYWSVSATGSQSQQKAAMDYLNQELFSDSYIDTLIQGGAIPTVTGIESKLASAPNADFLTYVYKMATNAKSFQLSWDQALSSSAAQTLLTTLSKLFLKQITPEQFCSTMAATK